MNHCCHSVGIHLAFCVHFPNKVSFDFILVAHECTKKGQLTTSSHYTIKKAQKSNNSIIFMSANTLQVKNAVCLHSSDGLLHMQLASNMYMLIYKAAYVQNIAAVFVNIILDT